LLIKSGHKNNKIF